MRWDVGLPRSRITKLEAVVDRILGVPEEVIAQSGYTWLRNESTGFFTEAEIQNFASSLPIRNNWSPIHVTNALLNAIDDVNSTNSAIGKKEEVFTDYEMQLMRQEFVERLVKRLNRYNKGYKLVTKEFNSDLVGFRWE